MTQSRTRRRPATPANVEGDLDHLIANMPEAFLDCRDFGHVWRKSTAREAPDGRYYEQDLKCTRCKSVKHRRVDNRVYPLGGSYNYVDGYRVEGLGAFDQHKRAAFRLAS